MTNNVISAVRSVVCRQGVARRLHLYKHEETTMETIQLINWEAALQLLSVGQAFIMVTLIALGFAIIKA